MEQVIELFHPNGGIKYRSYVIGSYKLEQYFDENTKWHRDPIEGPAFITTNIENGKYSIKEYYVNGKFHNPYGPCKDTVGKPYEWALNGVGYSFKVEIYLENNNMNWEDMSVEDFHHMWITII